VEIQGLEETVRGRRRRRRRGERKAALLWTSIPWSFL